MKSRSRLADGLPLNQFCRYVQRRLMHAARDARAGAGRRSAACHNPPAGTSTRAASRRKSTAGPTERPHGSDLPPEPPTSLYGALVCGAEHVVGPLLVVDHVLRVASCWVLWRFVWHDVGRRTGDRPIDAGVAEEGHRVAVDTRAVDGDAGWVGNNRWRCRNWPPFSGKTPGMVGAPIHLPVCVCIDRPGTSLGRAGSENWCRSTERSRTRRTGRSGRDSASSSNFYWGSQKGLSKYSSGTLSVRA